MQVSTALQLTSPGAQESQEASPEQPGALSPFLLGPIVGFSKPYSARMVGLAPPSRRGPLAATEGHSEIRCAQGLCLRGLAIAKCLGGLAIAKNLLRPFM